ncbi:hypothetical protein ACFWA5_27455 [Streptomyces mirabilis]|uniref:hypothetical protein n=1 Tax=Streptomyces mirabilis TaxID=68239 RepID=UPI003662FFF5
MARTSNATTKTTADSVGAPAPATPQVAAKIRVPHFVRGCLVWGDDSSYLFRDFGVPFVTPRIEFNELFAPRTAHRARTGLRRLGRAHRSEPPPQPRPRLPTAAGPHARGRLAERGHGVDRRRGAGEGRERLQNTLGDPFTTVTVLRTMADIAPDHPVLRSMSAVYWRGDDKPVEGVLYRSQYFDKVLRQTGRVGRRRGHRERRAVRRAGLPAHRVRPEGGDFEILQLVVGSRGWCRRPPS